MARFSGALLALIVVISGGAMAAWVSAQPAPQTPDPDTSTESTDAALEPPAQPMGDAPPEVAEPDEPVKAATPEELFEGILAARAREDRPALARCMASLAEKPTLDLQDAHYAYRNFLWRSIQPRWQRLEAAWQEGAWSLLTEEAAPDRARLVFQVGGSLGEDFLPLVRLDGRWYIHDR